MSKHTFFRIAIIILTIGVGGIASFAQDTLTEPTLDQVNARISALEGELIAVITAQAREKHKVEFGDEDAVPQRLESKKLEKQLMDLRTTYNERLRVLDKGIRTMEADVERRQKEIKDFRQLSDAIEREIAFAGITTNKVTDAQLAVLSAEAEAGRVHLVEVQAALDQVNRELVEKRAAVTTSDKKAGAMAKEISDLAERHAKAVAELSKSVDEKDEIGLLDQRRRKIVVELDLLRSQRTKLGRVESPAN